MLGGTGPWRVHVKEEGSWELDLEMNREPMELLEMEADVLLRPCTFKLVPGNILHFHHLVLRFQFFLICKFNERERKVQMGQS